MSGVDDIYTGKRKKYLHKYYTKINKVIKIVCTATIVENKVVRK